MLNAFGNILLLKDRRNPNNYLPEIENNAVYYGVDLLKFDMMVKIINPY